MDASVHMRNAAHVRTDEEKNYEGEVWGARSEAVGGGGGEEEQGQTSQRYAVR